MMQCLFENTVQRLVLPEDSLTTITRKTLSLIFGVAFLFVGGGFYYMYRGVTASDSDEQISLLILGASLLFFGLLVCLPQFIYVMCTKQAPDWLMEYSVLGTLVVVAIWDSVTVQFFPIRAVLLGLAFVTLGAQLSWSRVIVGILFIYYVYAEVREAWEITALRTAKPYKGGPIERFVVSWVGLFCFIFCSLLMATMVTVYTNLIEGAKKSIQLARSVSTMLLLFDTDLVRMELDDFEKECIKQEGGDVDALPPSGEGGNNNNEESETPGGENENDGNNKNKKKERPTIQDSSARELVEAYRELAANLDLYRPFLPDYVLPRNHMNLDGDMFDDEEAEAAAGLDMRSESTATPSGEHDENSNIDIVSVGSDNFGASPNRGGSKGRPSSAMQQQPSAGSFGNAGTENSFGADPFANIKSFTPSGGGGEKTGSAYRGTERRNSSYITGLTSLSPDAPAAPTASRNDLMSMARQTDAGTMFGNPDRARKLAAQAKRSVAVTMGTRIGTYVENCILARVDFTKLLQSVVSPSFDPSVVTSRVNKIVEGVLDFANKVDGTVHTIVEDAIIVSWNGTRKTLQSEIKCCKFLLEVRNIVQAHLVAHPIVSPAPPAGGSGSPKKGGGSATSTPKIGPSSPNISPSASPNVGGGGGGRRKSIGFEAVPPMTLPSQIPTTTSDEDEDGVPFRKSRSNSKFGDDEEEDDDNDNKKNKAKTISPRAGGNSSFGSTGSNSFGTRPTSGSSSTSSGASGSATTKMVTAAATMASAWCMIAGGKMRQVFMLSRFTNSDVLAKMYEMSKSHSWICVDQRICSRVRQEFNLQGCGVLFVPRESSGTSFVANSSNSGGAAAAAAAAAAAGAGAGAGGGSSSPVRRESSSESITSPPPGSLQRRGTGIYQGAEEEQEGDAAGASGGGGENKQEEGKNNETSSPRRRSAVSILDPSSLLAVPEKAPTNTSMTDLYLGFDSTVKKVPIPVYELISLKDVQTGHEDAEWLNQMSSGDVVQGLLIDCVNYLATSNIDRAKSVMQRLLKEAPDLRTTSSAFRSVERAVEECQKQHDLNATAL